MSHKIIVFVNAVLGVDPLSPVNHGSTQGTELQFTSAYLL